MTLLEVILSIAILGGAVAVIGEMARTAFQDAKLSRDMVQAELLAASILAKVQLGIIEMEPVFEMPVGLGSYANPLDIVEDTHAVAAGSTSNVLWLYSLDITLVEGVTAVDGNDYLVELAVTVRRNQPLARHPAVCRLVRWFALEPEVEEEEETL